VNFIISLAPNDLQVVGFQDVHYLNILSFVWRKNGYPRLIPHISGKLDVNNEAAKNGSKNDLTDILLRPEYVDGNLVPYPFRKYIKRKKKRGFSI